MGWCPQGPWSRLWSLMSSYAPLSSEPWTPITLGVRLPPGGSPGPGPGHVGTQARGERQGLAPSVKAPLLLSSPPRPPGALHGCQAERGLPPARGSPSGVISWPSRGQAQPHSQSWFWKGDILFGACPGRALNLLRTKGRVPGDSGWKGGWAQYSGCCRAHWEVPGCRGQLGAGERWGPGRWGQPLFCLPQAGQP